MNPKSGSIALLAGGSVSRSSVGQLSRLSEVLGPIKASSFRVASRVANLIRAGHPVHEIAEFADSKMVLVCVPDRAADNAALELDRSAIDWTDRVVVMCDTPRDSRLLAALSAKGARVASFNMIAGLAVMEGERAAIREFKSTLLPTSARVVRLEGGGKPLLFAGLTLAGFTAQLAAAASDCLRSAGIEPAQARKMVHNLMSDSLRAHTNAGHNALGTALQEPEISSMHLQHAALCATQPDLAKYFAAAMKAASEFAGALKERSPCDTPS